MKQQRRGVPVKIVYLLERIFRNCSFTMRTGLAKGLRRYYGFGFRPKFLLNDEERFLLGLDFYGQTVFDIGGYIGIYALFFARAVGSSGRVITFEPNPANYQELLRNLQLNKFSNVTALPLGLGRHCGQVDLIINPLYPSRGFVAEAQPQNAIQKKYSQTVPIKIITLDSLMQSKSLPSPDFIKIDVEGFELDVLHGMTEVLHVYKPRLFIEFHCKMPDLICFLLNREYTIYCVKSGNKITRQHIAIMNWGHLFCE